MYESILSFKYATSHTLFVSILEIIYINMQNKNKICISYETNRMDITNQIFKMSLQKKNTYQYANAYKS